MSSYHYNLLQTDMAGYVAANEISGGEKRRQLGGKVSKAQKNEIYRRKNLFNDTKLIFMIFHCLPHSKWEFPTHGA